MNPKLSLFIFLMLIALIGGFLLLNPILQNKENSLVSVNPCNEPITYRIGDIDNRFQVSGEDLLEVMREVEAIWNSGINGTAIQYKDDGDISVNLTYTDEQQLTESERQFRDRINTRRQSINVSEREFEQMNTRYHQVAEELHTESERLQRDLEELNRWVNKINEEGGFTQSELDQFEERKGNIDRRSDDLSRRGIELQNMAGELNQKADQLNEEIDRKNILVNEYNQFFTGTHRFTQGTYEWIGNLKKINVYQFNDRDELRLVLAHEVGHALGISEHVENPASVMHHLMGGQNRDELQLTSQDIQALREVCGI